MVVIGNVQVRWWRANIIMYLCSCNLQCYPSNSHHREITSPVWSRAIFFKATLKSKLCFQLVWGSMTVWPQQSSQGSLQLKSWFMVLLPLNAPQVSSRWWIQGAASKRRFKGGMDNTKFTHPARVLGLSQQMFINRVAGPGCSFPLNPHSTVPPRNLLSLGANAAS